MQTNHIKRAPAITTYPNPRPHCLQDSYQSASAQQTWPYEMWKCARSQVPEKRNTLFNPLAANWRTDVGAHTHSISQSVSWAAFESLSASQEPGKQITYEA